MGLGHIVSGQKEFGRDQNIRACPARLSGGAPQTLDRKCRIRRDRPKLEKGNLQDISIASTVSVRRNRVS